MSLNKIRVLTKPNFVDMGIIKFLIYCIVTMQAAFVQHYTIL